MSRKNQIGKFVHGGGGGGRVALLVSGILITSHVVMKVQNSVGNASRAGARAARSKPCSAAAGGLRTPLLTTTSKRRNEKNKIKHVRARARKNDGARWHRARRDRREQGGAYHIFDQMGKEELQRIRTPNFMLCAPPPTTIPILGIRERSWSGRAEMPGIE